MKRFFSAAILGFTLMASGCVYPTSTTVQGGVASSLSFSELPADAVIMVDGATVGMAGDYSGNKVLAVTPGTHKVTVQHQGRSIIDRDFYVGRESTVKVVAQ